MNGSVVDDAVLVEDSGSDCGFGKAAMTETDLTMKRHDHRDLASSIVIYRGWDRYGGRSNHVGRLMMRTLESAAGHYRDGECPPRTVSWVGSDGAPDNDGDHNRHDLRNGLDQPFLLSCMRMTVLLMLVVVVMEARQTMMTEIAVGVHGQTPHHDWWLLDHPHSVFVVYRANSDLSLVS